MTMDTAVVEKISQSPDKFGLLAHFVSHPAEDSSRLIDTEWLEEQGDKRGPLLRRSVRAFWAKMPLPELTDASANRWRYAHNGD